MKALRGIVLFAVSVLGFLVAGIASAGVGCLAILAGWERENLDENLRWVAYTTGAYFILWFVAFNGAILLFHRLRFSLKKSLSYAAEYAYLILTIVGLMSVADVVPTSAKYQAAFIEKWARVNVDQIQEAYGLGLEECAQPWPQVPGSDVRTSFCKWFEDASHVDYRLFDKGLLEALRIREESIQKKWHESLERPDFILIPGSSPEYAPYDKTGSLAVHAAMAASSMQGYIVNKEREEKILNFLLPESFLLIKIFAIFLIAFALALRLARTAAEASGLVAK